MPGIAKVTASLAGTGIITGPGAPTVKAEYSTVSVINDLVATHGEAPHIQPSIITASTTVFAEFKAVAVESLSTAACGHAVIAGATTVIVGR